jgi:hypothetical protein
MLGKDDRLGVGIAARRSQIAQDFGQGLPIRGVLRWESDRDAESREAECLVECVFPARSIG